MSCKIRGKPSNELREELINTLIAISIIAKRLAEKLEKEDKTDVKNE